MRKHTRRLGKLTIGLDVSDRYSYVCMLDEAGEVIEESRLATTKTAVHRWFGACPAARVALEVGPHSPWVERLLRDCGHEVLVANSRKLRMIYENERKTDRVDAEWLARVARLDPKLLAPIRHRAGRCQHDLAVVRARHALVVARTRLVNHVRGLVKAVGGRIVKCSTESFHKKAPSGIPLELRPALAPVIKTVAALTADIRKMETQIESMGRQRYPETALLRQVSGVGPVTATSFILTLEDPHRFKSNRSLGAYLGLTPRRNQSGDKDPQMRITKAGDSDLRRLLVGAAQYILGPFGPDSDLRRWGLSLAERGGKNAKKRAVVAVARKLAVLLHSLWRTGEVYEPLRALHTGVKRKAPREQVPA
jgi:transposase